MEFGLGRMRNVDRIDFGIRFEVFSFTKGDDHAEEFRARDRFRFFGGDHGSRGDVSIARVGKTANPRRLQRLLPELFTMLGMFRRNRLGRHTELLCDQMSKRADSGLHESVRKNSDSVNVSDQSGDHAQTFFWLQ